MATPSLQSVPWFPSVGGPKPEGGLASSLIEISVAAIAGLALRFTGHQIPAYVVWSAGGALGAVSIVSPRARRAVDGLFVRLGRAAGFALGAALLALVYLVVVTPLRFVRRALGADDLHLRDAERRSYWLPCDDEARKARWAKTMFATEPRRTAARRGLAALAAAIALLALAEGVLRTQGFGHALLYIADPMVGYYPQPNVALARYGGLVRTNEWGMRSPSAPRRKPRGAFRILMLGDSTLYGGSYVDQDDLYSTRVRKQLNDLGFPGPVEVLAMGCNGWGPFHERGYLKAFGTFDADLTLVHLPIDDINRPLYGLMSVPFFAADAPPRLALEEVANHFMWRYRSSHAGLGASWEARQSLLGIAEYGRLVDDLEAAGSEVMVFVLPSRSAGMGGRESHREAEWRAELEAEIDKRGVETHFAKGHFAGRGKPDEIYHDDVHLEPQGHRLYADFVASRILVGSARLAQWAGWRSK